MAVPGLGRKFWTMTSCTWPQRPWASAMAVQRRQPVGAGLADADQDAGGEGDGQPARGLQRRQAALGGLVRRPAVGGQVGAQRLEHHPLAGRHRPQPLELVVVERAGVGVGQQPGLLQDQAAHLGQVVDGRVVAVRGEPLACRGVALLGALAEGEQRLVAAGPGAGTGDGEHVVGVEVGLVQAGGRLRERAVAAAVAAQHRERDEDLGGVGHPGAGGGVTDGAGPARQLARREVEQIAHARAHYRRPLPIDGLGPRLARVGWQRVAAFRG